MGGILSQMAGIPARAAAVAGVTLVQLLRMRIFLVVAALALLMLGLQFLPYQEAVSVEYQGIDQLQLLKSTGLGCMQLFGLVFSVAATSLLIPRDSEDRILYTILCKPVPRFDYLLGKLAGVLLLLFLVFALMDGLLCLLIHLREAAFCERISAVLTERGADSAQISDILVRVHEAAGYGALHQGIIAMALGTAVLTSLTLLFSCFTSGTIVSMIFAFGAYFIGSFQQQLFNLMHDGGAGTGPLLRFALNALVVLLPDFSIFSLGDAAATGNAAGAAMLGQLALMACGYMLLHLLVATWIFNRKEF